MERLKKLISAGDAASAWSRVRALAQTCADYTALLSLARQADRLEKEAGPPKGLTPVRLALLSGATIDLLAKPLRLALLARGIAAEIHVGGYGQFVQEMIDPASPVTAFGPRIAVVVNTPYNLPAWPEIGTGQADAVELAEQAVDYLLKPCAALHDRTGCDIVLNNLHPPPARPAGNLGAKLPGDAANFVRRVNVALGDCAPSYVHIHDVAALVERVGMRSFFDARYWYHAKHPVSFASLPDYVRGIAGIVAAALGKSYKLVALDLDNTLWGGILGDDGLEGIEIGEGTPAGEAFKAFQMYLKALRDRGIVLAVCSKNDESIARRAFTDHPETILKLDDFVAFKANWQPKSDNLRAIAEELSLGLDSFVFVDDNPAEREQVRQILPQVAIPEVGDDPAEYPAMLDAGHYFEAVALTAEDRERTQTYRRRRAAGEALAAATDLTAYLKSLDMWAIVRPFDEASLERITQLTNKTNQFNVTTRRVTPAQMEALADDPQAVTRYVRLRDCFGDHGLICVFSATVDGEVMTVQDWLMSCRVLKRGVEFLLFNDILEEARRRGVRVIAGVYRPTERNALVKDLYRDLGFSPDGEAVDGGSLWRLEVSQAKPLEHFIETETPAS
ncbi:MAG: HAD family hydrolase [Phycisphaerae bacterium]|nr:HAD family hydrolase [Phycisphaerae bacterium]